jgi:hypothetical protein
MFARFSIFEASEGLKCLLILLLIDIQIDNPIVYLFLIKYSLV